METVELVKDEHEVVVSPSLEERDLRSETNERRHTTTSSSTAAPAAAEPSATDPFFFRTNDALLDTSMASDMLMVDPECNAVLDTMDTCVGMVEGVDEQHAYEEKLAATDEQHSRHLTTVANQHGLTAAEVALIRLQIMEEKKQPERASTSATSPLPDLDILNICGNEDDMTDAMAATHFKMPPDYSSATTAAAAGGDHDNTLASTSLSSAAAAARSVSPINNNTSPLFCSICFEEAGSIPNDGLLGSNFSDNKPSRGLTFAFLPCCGSEGREETSTTKVCTVCILLLTQPTSDGDARIGRCPRCRSWIAVQTSSSSSPHAADGIPSLNIRPVRLAGKCDVCNQVKETLVENDNVCDACFLGRRFPLLYECEQCHAIQRIPHPMYRYQPSVTEFGRVSWACYGTCRSFTQWRIVTSQVRLIPSGDAPEEWGEDYLQLARARVMEARQGFLGPNNNTNNNQGDTAGQDGDEEGDNEWSSSCAIQ